MTARGRQTAPATRWALSPTDFRAHAVDLSDATGPEVLAARCGHAIPARAGLDDEPRAQLCAGCALMVAPVDDQARSR